MRKLVLGLSGAAVLGLAAIASQGAQAQEVTVTFGSGFGSGYGSHWDRPAYGYPAYERPGYSRPVHYDGGFGRPVYYERSFERPRCFVRIDKYWDGDTWVRERRRICR